MYALVHTLHRRGDGLCGRLGGNETMREDLMSKRCGKAMLRNKMVPGLSWVVIYLVSSEVV